MLQNILGRIFGGISSSGIEGIVEGTFLIEGHINISLVCFPIFCIEAKPLLGFFRVFGDDLVGVFRG